MIRDRTETIRMASPEYFSTLHVPLVMGRDFAPQDRQGTELVAIVDTTLAHQYWPGKNPIGEHIGFNDRVKGPWYTIVGLAAHARASSLESDTNEGFFYVAAAQGPQLSTAIVVRSSRSAERLDRATSARRCAQWIPAFPSTT